MRLINTRTLRLEDFSLREMPPYAILSHTWGDYELTFQDMITLNPVRYLKRGYIKISQTCRLAREKELDYAWIDTCCIDKTSSAELTEAINSMFRYYEHADICFAHLADLPQGSTDISTCRWFTRGWTLQELLAPRTIEFHNSSWQFIGSKASFVEIISTITNVPRHALEEPWGSYDFSVAAKMSWASARRTTRTEDIAYSLLGIFNVSMPLLYGEGDKAFQRLQEEIVKRDADMTILAWSSSSQTNLPGVNLLAPSPAVFHGSGNVERAESADMIGVNFAISNSFLEWKHPIYEIPHSDDRQRKVLGVRVGIIEVEGAFARAIAVLMPLRLIGPTLLCRHKNFPLTFGNTGHLRQWQQMSGNGTLPSHNIVTYNIERTQSHFTEYREAAIRVMQQPGIKLTKALPALIWDPEDGVLLRSRTLDIRPESIILCFARGYSSWLISCELNTEPLRAGILVAKSRSEILEFAERNFHLHGWRHQLDYSRSDEILSISNGHLIVSVSLSNPNSRTMIYKGKITFRQGLEDAVMEQ